MIKLPLYPTISSNFEYNINLENQVCIINCAYNIRNEFFHFTFTDGQDNIIRNIKMVPGFPLLKHKKGFTVLKGDFFMFKTSQAAGDLITYDNFGNSWNLFYLTRAQVIDWENSIGI